MSHENNHPSHLRSAVPSTTTHQPPQVGRGRTTTSVTRIQRDWHPRGCRHECCEIGECLQFALLRPDDGSLEPDNPAEAPGAEHDPFGKDGFEFPDRPQIGDESALELLKLRGILIRQDYLSRQETMSQGVLRGCGLSGRRLRPSGQESGRFKEFDPRLRRASAEPPATVVRARRLASNISHAPKTLSMGRAFRAPRRRTL
jgi:hypothetical protein